MIFPSSSSNNLSSKDTMLKKDPRFSRKIVLPFSAPPFIFIQTLPFFRQPPQLKPNFWLLLTTKSSAFHVVGQIHNSLLSSAHKFLTMLHNFALQNPLLSKLLSFSSHHLRSTSSSQIPCRNYGNLETGLNHNFAAILPGDSVAGIAVTNGILNFLNIYNTLLVVRLVLTWFPNAPPAVVSPLSTICDPYLNIFRGIIPPLGGTLDLSPILAFLVLNAFTSTAAALPAELPSTGVSQNLPSHTTVSHLTISQRQWMRRLAGDKSKNSSSEN